VLFWVVVTVFSLTAVLALVGVANGIGLIHMPPAADAELSGKLVWALWGTVLVEGVGLFYILARDLLGLEARSEINDLRNTLGEVIDGFEATNVLDAKAAGALRKSLGDRVSAVGPVLKSNSSE
jgi:hypothetical protein